MNNVENQNNTEFKLERVTAAIEAILYAAGHPVEYEKLSEKMPDSHIIWMIPIGNQSYASTSQEILVDSVAKEDIPLFDLFDHLTTIRALNAECYEELLLLENALPNCKVEWAVHIGNAGFSPESCVYHDFYISSYSSSSLNSFSSVSSMIWPMRSEVCCRSS